MSRSSKGIFTAPERNLPVLEPTAKLHEGARPPEGRVLNRDQDLPHGTESFSRLETIMSQLREGQTAIATHLQGLISTYELEWAYNASATALSSQAILVAGAQQNAYSTLQPFTSEEILIDTVNCFIPAGTAGLLTLGSVQIPVGSPLAANWQGAAPSLTLTQQKFLLQSSDLRSLVLTTGSAGPMGLVLAGQVAPTRGRIPL